MFILPYRRIFNFIFSYTMSKIKSHLFLWLSSGKNSLRGCCYVHYRKVLLPVAAAGNHLVMNFRFLLVINADSDEEVSEVEDPMDIDSLSSLQFHRQHLHFHTSTLNFHTSDVNFHTSTVNSNIWPSTPTLLLSTLQLHRQLSHFRRQLPHFHYQLHNSAVNSHTTPTSPSSFLYFRRRILHLCR